MTYEDVKRLWDVTLEYASGDAKVEAILEVARGIDVEPVGEYDKLDPGAGMDIPSVIAAALDGTTISVRREQRIWNSLPRM